MSAPTRPHTLPLGVALAPAYVGRHRYVRFITPHRFHVKVFVGAREPQRRRFVTADTHPEHRAPRLIEQCAAFTAVDQRDASAVAS